MPEIFNPNREENPAEQPQKIIVPGEAENKPENVKAPPLKPEADFYLPSDVKEEIEKERAAKEKPKSNLIIEDRPIKSSIEQESRMKGVREVQQEREKRVAGKQQRLADLEIEILQRKEAANLDSSGLVPKDIIEKRKQEIRDLEKERRSLIKDGVKIKEKEPVAERGELASEVKQAKAEKLPEPPKTGDLEKMQREIDETNERQERRDENQEAEPKKQNPLEILTDPQLENRKPSEVLEAFREITKDEPPENRLLAKRRREMAAQKLEAKGYEIIKGKEAIEKAQQDIALREDQKIKNQENEQAMQILAERAPEKYKKDQETFNKYVQELQRKTGLDGVDGKYAFNRLVISGYEVEKAKKAWFSDQITIPGSSGGKNTEQKPMVLKNKFAAINLSKEVSSDISKTAKAIAEDRIKMARDRVKQERQVCGKEIIEKTVEDYKAKQEGKNPKEAEVLAEQKKPEKKEQEASENTQPSIKEIKALSKKTEALVKKAQADKKRILELMKKRQKGKLLTAREVAEYRSLQIKQELAQAA